MKLVTSVEMQLLDRISIEKFGIPGIVLMENAGKAVADFINERCASFNKIYIFCGPGNNGGDGLVVARHLFNRGFSVKVFLGGSKDKLKKDAKTNMAIVSNMGIEIKEVFSSSELSLLEKELIEGKVILVDALLGTGVKGAPRGIIGEMVRLINRLNGIKIAVDIPTGVNADTGEVQGEAIKATYTVTFAYPKRGIYLYPGMDYVGEVKIADIGIPHNILEKEKIKIQANLLLPEDLPLEIFTRKPSSHKGEFGHLFVLAGSKGLTGAAVLASQAALKVGAGLVTLGVPASLNPIFEVKLTEVMTLPLPETEQGSLSPRAFEKIMQFAEKCNALIIGPGLSRNSQTQKLIQKILKNLKLPIVVDADGINALAGKVDLISSYQAPMVLTPHPGEMARLRDTSVSEVQKDRIKSATTLAQETGKVVVLKGAGTVVARSDGECWINTTGNPGMASGGTGDVLTGIIGGFLVQGMKALDAAKLGVYLHGLAADFAAKEKEEVCLIAQDIIENLPVAIKSLRNKEFKNGYC